MSPEARKKQLWKIFIAVGLSLGTVHGMNLHQATILQTQLKQSLACYPANLFDATRSGKDPKCEKKYFIAHQKNLYRVLKHRLMLPYCFRIKYIPPIMKPAHF